MKTYRLLFMDLDETLLDFKRAEAEALSASFADFGIPLTEEAETVFRTKNRALWKALERGEITQSELRVERFRQLFEELGQAVDSKVFSERYIRGLASGAFPLPYAVEVCRYLAEKYRLLVLTNGIADVQYPRIRQSPFAGLFEAVIISEEVGISKPDPAIFEYACRHVGFYDKEAIMMIGDSMESDIRGAVNFGIDSCWLNRNGAPAPEGATVPTREIRELRQLRGFL